jgi:putative FmdB family regulatory protein
VPIYEYRCPNGHVFEVFQRMDDTAPDACETCGASPLQRVLFPVAVHFKGSGFYSTDYGRSRKPTAKDAGEGGGSSSDTASESKPEKKAADPS